MKQNEQLGVKQELPKQFSLGLFILDIMRESYTYGNSNLSSIDIQDIWVLQRKLKDFKIIFPLNKIGDNWV